MGESINEPRIIHLHKKVLDALATATAQKPVMLATLRKLAQPVLGGEKILDQFLEQLFAAKAIMRSNGMSDGERFAAYWATESFGDFARRTTAAAARTFTAAEKALIRKVHGFMPAQQLLDILNERLVCDLGADAVLYTMEQLYTEIGGAAGGVPAGGHDWASLRKLIAKAERDGVLDTIDEQTIDDFAVIFSLNSKQVMVLKDIILQAKEQA